MNKLMKRKLGKKGFTLVELIVVIAIIAVLAVVGIPAIAGQVAKSQMAAAESNAKLISSQAQTWITEDEINPPATARITATTYTKTTLKPLLAACGVSETKIEDATMKVTLKDETSTGGVKYLSVDEVTCKVGSQTATWTRAVATPPTPETPPAE